MLDLDALLAKADELLASVEPEVVPVVLAGQSVAVRYLPMSGEEWRDLTLRHPPRTDVLQDMNLGYNVDAVVSAYPDVVLINGDAVDDMMRVDAEGARSSVWPAVWKRLTATGRRDVATSMWAAHERDPERLVDAAGKASPGGRKKKRT